MALAAGYGVLLGGALAFGLDPVYAVLLTALLMTMFFALLGWRATVEWRTAMRELRPVVQSDGWYERLTTEGGAREDGEQPLRALCEDVLRAPLAYLVPAGPLASFVAPQCLSGRQPAAAPLVGAARASVAAAPGASASRQTSTAARRWRSRCGASEVSRALCFWQAGRTGRCIARRNWRSPRATGERLIDAAASLALSQKLMALQRERMAQTQLLDQRTRRVLHDEVLPLIHTAMLTVSAGQEREVALQRLSEAHAQIAALLRDLPASPTPDVARLGPLAALRKAVETEFGQAFHAVTWEVDEEADSAARQLPALKAETLYFAGRELIRNAARHAQPQEGEGRELRVRASRCGRASLVEGGR